MSFNEKWNLDELIDMLRKEIESREMCQMMTNKVKTLDKRSENNTDDFTALLSDTSHLSCTYSKRNHSSSKCTVITDIKARRAFVRNKGKCYVCLKSGHLASLVSPLNVLNVGIATTFLYVNLGKKRMNNKWIRQL